MTLSDEELVHDVLDDLHRGDALAADGTKALGAFSRLIRERDAARTTAEELREAAIDTCNEYPLYEEFDLIRKVLGLPLYVENLTSGIDYDRERHTKERE